MIWICFAIMAGVIALDQATKWIVVLNMSLGQSVDVIPGVFRFTYSRNPGAAFGIFRAEDERWIFLVFSTVAIAGVIYYLVKYRPASRFVWIPLSMITGGGISNMIDRLFYGERVFHGTVVDMLDFCAFPNLWTAIFNVADSFVCVGAGILFVYLLLDIIRDYKHPEEKKQEEDNGGHSDTDGRQ